MEKQKAYTPSSIATSELLFSIPLYQRLFEWEPKQIEQLLTDLKISYHKDPTQPYYIGMLTAYVKDAAKNSAGEQEQKYPVFDLVDGQQRFTVLTLLAIALKWDDRFSKLTLNTEERMRLSFFARPNDAEYLKSKINGETENGTYINSKMETGIICITDFLKTHFVSDKEKKSFSDYIFNYLTFFISTLPETYKTYQLNKYFEAMNATGRGLENHEILKVTLLKQLPNDSDKELFTQVWNAISEMDRPLIRKTEKEDINSYKARQKDALEKIGLELEAFKLCNDTGEKIDIDKSDFVSIKDIGAKNEKPKEIFHIKGERALLTFPEFLLHVLWLQLCNEKRTIPTDFFNVHKLQEIFGQLNKADDIKLFFYNLLKYRLLFDYFIVRVSNNEQSSSSYTLCYREEIDDTANDKGKKQRLIQYQSMLYVSTSTNIWLTEILIFLEKDPNNIGLDSFLAELKLQDNFRRKNENISLTYSEINRYWFWRLDHYLWEKELEKDQANQNKAIINYTFRPNRSIEHLYPQTSDKPWVEKDLHSFGNLAMISPGFNSTQSNDDILVKFARIEKQIRGPYLLENIKLLFMYQKGNGKEWTIELAKEHEKEMIQILADSFPQGHVCNDALNSMIQNQQDN